eukprot:11315524-Alexandrium_andersonii.AAC.1
MSASLVGSEMCIRDSPPIPTPMPPENSAAGFRNVLYASSVGVDVDVGVHARVRLCACTAARAHMNACV